MRLHRHLAEAVASSLHDIFAENYYADKVIERHLRFHKKWGSRDRKFYAETTYEMVRWWRRLWHAWGREPSLDKDSLFKLVGLWLSLAEKELPPWPEWKIPEDYARRFAESEILAVRESIPDWLDSLGQEQLKTEWPEILQALNSPAPVFLRPNRVKIDVRELQERLKAEGIDTEQVEDALILRERKNVFQTQAFKQGLFEVQDLHSQHVGPLLQVEPGQRVIDACAGAGGKTLHLAALMKNKGRVIALDIHPHKLSELSKRARRAGVDVIETRVVESRKVIKRLRESADRLLLDVPCSGLGVLRRNPDSKWKLQPERVEELTKLQAELLDQYSTMLKPGGKMVYATCSVLPCENHNQVEAFLKTHPDWTLEEEVSYQPQAQAGDGFYMARLRKPQNVPIEK